MSLPQAQAAQKTRIQLENQSLILDAALAVFAAHGYRGSTVDEIASRCGMSKPNLLYYFKSKDAIYRAVLEHTLDVWLRPLDALDPAKEPLVELERYITAKLAMTFARPEASRIFANEILQGGGHVRGFLEGPLKVLVEAKVAVIRHWIAEGKLKAVEPTHLIFAIWAVTQHYADFAVQVEAVMGRKPGENETLKAVLHILLGGLKQ